MKQRITATRTRTLAGMTMQETLTIETEADEICLEYSESLMAAALGYLKADEYQGEDAQDQQPGASLH